MHPYINKNTLCVCVCSIHTHAGLTFDDIVICNITSKSKENEVNKTWTRVIRLLVINKSIRSNQNIENMSGSDSDDYVVENYVKPNRIAVPLINDERADILGNFDDSKLKDSLEDNNKYKEDENPFDEQEDGDSDESDDAADGDAAPDIANGGEDGAEAATESVPKKSKSKQTATKTSGTTSSNDKSLTDTQINNLLRGASKKDRFVLYVTNLSYETSKEKLVDFFSAAGIVKSVRIPKTRRNAFAFIEMLDLEGFKVNFIAKSTGVSSISIMVIFFFSNSHRMHYRSTIVR